jgi:hypothetical protein
MTVLGLVSVLKKPFDGTFVAHFPRFFLHTFSIVFFRPGDRELANFATRIRQEIMTKILRKNSDDVPK